MRGRRPFLKLNTMDILIQYPRGKAQVSAEELAGYFMADPVYFIRVYVGLNTLQDAFIDYLRHRYHTEGFSIDPAECWDEVEVHCKRIMEEQPSPTMEMHAGLEGWVIWRHTGDGMAGGLDQYGRHWLALYSNGRILEPKKL